MALFDWLSETTGPVVRGEAVTLRIPSPVDHAAWAALREQSRAYLQPWEPLWPEDDLGRAAFRRRLTLYEREMDAGNAWPFFIHRTDDDALVGAVTLSNIRRGVAETGTLGYWIGQPFAGQGLATDAVRALCGFAFDTARLHRVEAACVPANIASRRVLEKAGFEHEGQARAYLKINGAWADHVLFGLVRDETDHGA
jgi:ribosomal-protein-alanine N-acetyltransferase